MINISELGDNLTLRELFFADRYAQIRAVKLIEGIRPELIFAAIIAEEKLRLNDHKRNWDNCPPMYFINRLREEHQEFRDTVEFTPIFRENETGDSVWCGTRAEFTPASPGELADIINFSAFAICQIHGIPCSRRNGNGGQLQQDKTSTE